MTSSRIAHVAHILGIVASALVAIYFVVIGYTMHRELTEPGVSLWRWSDAVGIMLIGVAVLHLCVWRLFHAIHS